MLRVIRNHRRAAYDAPAEEYEGLSVTPMGINPELAPADLVGAAREAWDRALAGGELYGYRNAQTTLLAPTGTIGLLMDCDTTGVEPDFALVKFKKLAGGGYFKIANQSIEPALKNLGYGLDERLAILTYVLGTLSLDGAPHINRESLKAKGFTDEDIDKVEKALPGVFELGFAFNAWVLGEEALGRAGISMEQASKPGFELLRALGFTRQQIDEANEHICGTMTVEGAPHLQPEHLPVFDTANKCGKKGTRFIHHMGHIKMMSAAQSFLSGAISKTINMPNEATVDDILDAYKESWAHWPEGDGALPRRLQAEPAALGQERHEGRGREPGYRGGRSRQRGRRRRGEGARRRGTGAGGSRRQRRAGSALTVGEGAGCAQRAPRTPRSSATTSWRTRRRCGRSRIAAACLPAGPGSRRRRGSPGRRSTCAPASTKTARSARSSSTSIRKAPPSAR